MRQIYDTFTDPDATILNVHAPETDREGGGYTMVAGAWTIQGNRAASTAIANARAVIDAGISDGSFKANIMTGTPGGAAYLVFRSNVAGTNFFMAGLFDAPGSIRLYRADGMVLTLLGTFLYAQDELTTYEIKVVTKGDLILVHVNDVLVISQTDLTYYTQTYTGLYASNNALARFDELTADTLTTCHYCTTADVKAHYGEQWTSGTKYDTLLEDLIGRASRLIDREQGWAPCHYAAGDPAATARVFDTVSGYEMEVDRCIQTGAAIAVDETATGVYVPWVLGTDYVLWPYNEEYFTRIIVKDGAGKVFTTGQQLLQVTGNWGGMTVPPAEIEQATIITAARWFKRGMQAFQDTGAVVEVGQLRYTKALDPDVKEILRTSVKRTHFG